MAFEISTVANYIAALVVAGKTSDGNYKAVTMLGFDGIKDSTDFRQCPIFQPDLSQSIVLESHERDSYGSGLTAKQTLIYTMPYVLLYEPAGSTRGLHEIVPNMAYTLSRIASALIRNDTPGDLEVDMTLAAITMGVTITDPSGNQYLGASVTVRVKEFVDFAYAGEPFAVGAGQVGYDYIGA